MSPKRKLMDNMPRGPECRVSVGTGSFSPCESSNDRRVHSASHPGALPQHDPALHDPAQGGGLTIIDYVLQAKTECKKTRGKKLGSAFWLGVRNLFADADFVTPDLQVNDMNQVVSEALVKALDQARTANCTYEEVAGSFPQLAADCRSCQPEGVRRHREACTQLQGERQPGPTQGLKPIPCPSIKQIELTTQVSLTLQVL